MYKKLIVVLLFSSLSCSTSKKNCESSVTINEKLENIGSLLVKKYKYLKSKIYRTDETTLLSSYIDFCKLDINESKILKQSLAITLVESDSLYMPSRFKIEICKYRSTGDAENVFKKVMYSISKSRNRDVVPCVEPYDLRIYSVYIKDCTLIFFNKVSNLDSSDIDNISKIIESEFYK